MTSACAMNMDDYCFKPIKYIQIQRNENRTIQVRKRRECRKKKTWNRLRNQHDNKINLSGGKSEFGWEGSSIVLYTFKFGRERTVDTRRVRKDGGRTFTFHIVD